MFLNRSWPNTLSSYGEVFIMVCVSFDCPKYRDCVRTEGEGQAEAFATHGYGYISAERIIDHYDCGPLGNYAMYVPKIKEIFGGE